MPTLVSSPPRVASSSTVLSTTSGNSAFVFTIPANSDTQQQLIYAFGTTNPESSDASATLQLHLDSGNTQLDLTKPLSSSTDGTSTGDSPSSAPDTAPLTSRQRMIVTHAILCVVGFALLLPVGALLARYLRTTTPTWYTGHWIAQFVISGPVIIAGVAVGFQVTKQAGITIWDDHKKTGVVLLALYLMQCILGAFIHYVKLRNFVGRPPQNYFHAVLGLTIIALGMYQIRTGYKEEWPNFSGLQPVPKGLNTLWLVWCIVLPVLYAGGLLFLRKQYRQEQESRKGR
ncbi:hypothetical protein B0H17DRAFT_33752 [Mycena rosella]|uniref:Cytochrome b561 domain-containing protein n=1 Tax=Mycena rosella TaxID=1033263 RepID=A0AAD7D7Q7_MYCRO|nr:hypothetical protein B0H17DRAFT_33752 [Mycena rosella]